jgi:hypothetical protein
LLEAKQLGEHVQFKTRVNVHAQVLLE